MRLLHLSDTHLYGDPAARHYDRIDTAAALEAVLERLRGALDPDGIELILHTGDASEDGTEESYRRLHELLDPFAAELGAPLLVAMGNHDVPAAYAQVRGPGDHAAPFQDRTLLTPDGLRAIVLDTSVPGAGYGHLEPAQLEWLAQVLASPAPAGTVIAMHHPPLVAATPMLRALDLDGLDELAEVLRGSDVRCILSGHYHHEMSGAIAGIPVHVVPGITNVVDPFAPGGHERALALSGVSVVDLDDAVETGAGRSPRVVTTVLPSAGDAREGGPDPSVPVYDFGGEAVREVIRTAGR